MEILEIIAIIVWLFFFYKISSYAIDRYFDLTYRLEDCEKRIKAQQKLIENAYDYLYERDCEGGMSL